MKQIPLPFGPAAAPTFDSYFAGPNAAAHQHLKALQLPSPPVYLWGPSGSGKTHLLEATAQAVRGGGGATCSYGPATPAPWPLPPGASLVCIDGCELLDAQRQHAAFTTFVGAAAAGVQVVAAGRVPPVDLPLRDDLRTRLAWGHVFALQPLDDDAAAAALRDEARRRGFALPEEVARHLLLHFPRALSHLMPLLDRLDAYAMSRQRPVTLPLLREMLAGERAATHDGAVVEAGR